jgi:hypothetical protein
LVPRSQNAIKRRQWSCLVRLAPAGVVRDLPLEPQDGIEDQGARGRVRRQPGRLEALRQDRVVLHRRAGDAHHVGFHAREAAHALGQPRQLRLRVLGRGGQMDHLGPSEEAVVVERQRISLGVAELQVAEPLTDREGTLFGCRFGLEGHFVGSPESLVSPAKGLCYILTLGRRAASGSKRRLGMAPGRMNLEVEAR